MTDFSPPLLPALLLPPAQEVKEQMTSFVTHHRQPEKESVPGPGRWRRVFRARGPKF